MNEEAKQLHLSIPYSSHYGDNIEHGKIFDFVDDRIWTFDTLCLYLLGVYQNTPKYIKKKWIRLGVNECRGDILDVINQTTSIGFANIKFSADGNINSIISALQCWEKHYQECNIHARLLVLQNLIWYWLNVETDNIIIKAYFNILITASHGTFAPSTEDIELIERRINLICNFFDAKASQTELAIYMFQKLVQLNIIQPERDLSIITNDQSIDMLFDGAKSASSTNMVHFFCLSNYYRDTRNQCT